MIASVKRGKAFDKISRSFIIKICSELSEKELPRLDKRHLFFKNSTASFVLY